MVFAEVLEQRWSARLEGVDPHRGAVVPASLVDADQIGAMQNAYVIGDGRFADGQLLIEQRAWDAFRAAGEHYPEHLDPYRLA